MKKRPYCAEEIQDEAIRCRYCRSDLTKPLPGASPAVAAPAPVIPRPHPQVAIAYSHSGVRYVLGYGLDFFGIWDRTVPDQPVRTFQRTDSGWHDAWNRFAGLEPQSQSVPAGASAPFGRYGQPPRTNGMSVASLVLGILGVYPLWVIGPILALIFGFVGKGQIDRSHGALKAGGWPSPASSSDSSAPRSPWASSSPRRTARSTTSARFNGPVTWGTSPGRTLRATPRIREVDQP